MLLYKIPKFLLPVVTKGPVKALNHRLKHYTDISPKYHIVCSVIYNTLYLVQMTLFFLLNLW